MAYIIRSMQKNDIVQVVQLEEALLGETLGFSMLEQEMRNPVVSFLVLEINHIIVGYIGGYFCQGIGEILNFVIAKTHQHQGYGQALFQYLLQANKPKALTLEVKCNNQAAIAFYQKNGFRQISIRKHYYQDGTDALVMMKEYI